MNSQVDLARKSSPMKAISQALFKRLECNCAYKIENSENSNIIKSLLNEIYIAQVLYRYAMWPPLHVQGF